MARLRVEVVLTICHSVEIEVPGYDGEESLEWEDCTRAYDMVPETLALENALDLGREDFHVVEVIRDSDVALAEVKATTLPPEWGEE